MSMSLHEAIFRARAALEGTDYRLDVPGYALTDVIPESGPAPEPEIHGERDGRITTVSWMAIEIIARIEWFERRIMLIEIATAAATARGSERILAVERRERQ